ncbi:MAG: ADP-ribose pyrophosphatase [Stutzerimonas stutzeri]|nr:MAG: ADP-ribose pyrophosphatase [Stutzerimonas stutzeri]
MAREFNFGVYIGRFQPLHVGHEAVIREALTKVDTLIIVIGSAGIAPNPHNPFTFEQREAIFKQVFRHEITAGRISILSMWDYEDDNDWAITLARRVHRRALDLQNPNPNFTPIGLKDLRFALAGYGKDASSFYLKMFPDWASIQIQTQHGTISASDIRHDYLRRLPRMPRDAVSEPVLASLQTFSLTDQFKRLVEDVEAYKKGREEFGEGPFLTADVFIQHGDHILLVTRGRAPGRGLKAMPGGFVEGNETFQQAGYREASEETGLTREELEEFYQGFVIGDNPNRSLRGRIVTGISIFVIPADQPRPAPVAGDDAAAVGWFHKDELKSEDFFDDHYPLIMSILEN